MCYVGKATKIFIFFIAVIVVTSLVIGFGIVGRNIHPKSHKCSGEYCSLSDSAPPAPIQFPFPSNPSDPAINSIAPPPPQSETSLQPPAPPETSLPPPPSPETSLPPPPSLSDQSPPPPATAPPVTVVTPPAVVTAAPPQAFSPPSPVQVSPGPTNSS